MPSPKRRKLQHKPAAAKPTAATESSSFLLSPDAPIIISSYLRVVFHALALFIITVFLCYTVTASKAQIEERITQEIAAMQVEILECKRKYIEYECASSHRLDLFREHCIQWDKYPFFVPGP
ncbi:uncharacterized protein BYT42DRAFT_613535 [Radiomyces spectabilis]|uniref:uncharacterized protein n=1 Tax=Radiomyces spectabilis TaxID=64574 RepID=UPI00221EC669|nr:uncharacterized protein BYT42DRAFT_613535 [Radiomyces spectabilis]KAI8379208.1 hypothetical protein BYT42DRAFT_613535 [Radiomyces spectabilis]